MKWNIYTVFDVCAGVYDRPFVAHSDPAAARSFGDLAVTDEHPVGRHPEHFTLHRLGVYDDNTGEIVAEAPTTVCTALEMIAQSQKIAPGSLKETEIHAVTNGA